MKPRHAAALALVGWYLMLPPVVGGKHHWHLDLSAPLSQWHSVARYDTATQCTNAAGAITNSKDVIEASKAGTFPPKIPSS
jgi:hypothetical protein